MFPSLLLLLSTTAAEPTLTPVFTAGQGDYHTYRIPSLIVSAKGTLLAFCEGRKAGRGDAGNIDLVLRRSTDGGQTWGPLQVVWDDGDNTCGNPCPIVDASTGTIWLLLTHNLGKDTEQQIVNGTAAGSRTAWVSKSTDDGATWAKPVEITEGVKQKDWTWYATGPGVGIQLASGRLVIPCDNKNLGGKVLQSHVIYSDDHGATWKLGGSVGPNCNESQVIARADGSLLLNMRNHGPEKRRLIATSKDAGLTWTPPTIAQDLIEPTCQGSILSHPREKGLVLFSNPASTKRESMTLRVSSDDAATWDAQRVLHAGPAAYSCLAVPPDNAITCLFECGEKQPYETITLARCTLNWLRSK